MKEARKNVAGISAIISIIFLIFSLFFFLLTWYGMSIHRVLLSNSLFDGTAYNFSFGNLKDNTKYNVKLRLIRKADRDYMDVVQKKYDFAIKVLLRDSRGRVLTNKDINKDSQIPYGWSAVDIELTLASFEAEKQGKYYLKLEFNNSYHFFDLFENKRNKLFVEEDYDYAILPYIHFLHWISTVLLFVSLLLAVTTVSILVKKRQSSKAGTKTIK